MDITSLCGAMGAEVRGIDLTNLDAEAKTAVVDAFHEHLVLVFPDQDLAPGDQITFTELFGPVEPHPLKTRRSIDGFPGVLVIENKPGQPGARNDYWHSDISHAEKPPAVSVLHALKIPASRGDTLFCNMNRAYEGLSDGLRQVLNPLKALHSGMPTYLRSLEHSDARNLNPDDINPSCAHPVVRTHPVTGRPALFINPHFTTGFENMTEDESRPLLAYLYERALQPENIYRHRWRAGDVIIWDNRATMHYAVLDYTEDMPRYLHRTTGAGDVPFAAET